MEDNILTNDEEQEFIQTMNNIPLQLLGDTESIKFHFVETTDLITSKKFECYKVNNDNYQPIHPNVCININNNDECKITKQGSYSRSRVFDVNFSFYLNIPLYYCSSHNQYFSILSFLQYYEKEIDKIVTFINDVKTSIIVFNQTIVVSNYNI